MLSTPGQRALELTPVPCPDLEALPWGTLFLRDLDGDGVLDYVIESSQTLYAYLNHPGGFEPVLGFDWPKPNDHASAINLAQVDLNGDGRLDLVLGFDRATDPNFGWETGALSFIQQASGQFTPGLALPTPVSNQIPDTGVFSGYVTAGRFFGDSSTVALVGYFGGPYERSSAARIFESSAGNVSAPVPGTVLRLATIPGPGGHDLLATVNAAEFSWWDLTSAPHAVLTEPLAFETQISRELGGGREEPLSHFFDIDGDGDLDFLELGDLGFSLQVNLGANQFAPAMQFPVLLSRNAEHPFLHVGATTALLTQAQVGAVPTVVELQAQ